MPNYEKDRLDAILMARTWLANPDDFLILDTETTGLGDDDEIIEIAIINMRGEMLLDTLVRPARKTISREATDVHGINATMLDGAPTWARVFPKVKAMLQGRGMVVYNLAFDARLMAQSCASSQIAFDLGGKHWCSMLAYASYIGEWNDAKGSYRWHKLPSAGHRAVNDCRATLEIIQAMAATRLEIEPRQSYRLTLLDRLGLIPRWQKVTIVLVGLILLLAFLGSTKP